MYLKFNEQGATHFFMSVGASKIASHCDLKSFSTLRP